MGLGQNIVRYDAADDAHARGSQDIIKPSGAVPKDRWGTLVLEEVDIPFMTRNIFPGYEVNGYIVTLGSRMQLLMPLF